MHYSIRMMKMKSIELLAPAGDMEALKAAVLNGADAVYIGGKSFSARQYAGNFDDEEMIRAVEYCHIMGVKVYVTLNILLKDAELYNVPETAAFLYNAGVDALIIQDVGVGKLIREILPEFELHASTQMTAHNLDGVRLLYEMGYKRVVLSRELSMQEISQIAHETEAEIEVFVHGALCICYSGQCLMSSMIGGRSGNRGRCAQPCRMSYAIDTKSGRSMHLLSPKDLSTIEHIDDLIKCGVKSLKVEGRMKKPEYVAAVIGTYRKAIDKFMESGKVHVSEEDNRRLLMAFNRGGFTTAHLYNKAGLEMMSIERPKNWGMYLGTIADVNKGKGRMEVQLEDDLSKGDGIEIWAEKGENIGYIVGSIFKGKALVEKANKGDRVLLEYKGGRKGDRIYKTMDRALSESIESTYKSTDPIRKIPLECSVSVKEGKPSGIKLWDEEGNIAHLQGPIPEKAEKAALSNERLSSYITKTGGTPFYIKCLNMDIDPGLMLPASAINSLRREALDEIKTKRIEAFKPEKVCGNEVYDRAEQLLKHKIVKKDKNIRLSVMVKDISLVEAAIDGGADIIVFGGDILRGFHMDFKKAAQICQNRGVELYIATPRVMKQEYDDVMGSIYVAIYCGGRGYGNLYADNLGALRFAHERSIPFAAGFSLNIFNSMSAFVFESMGSRFSSLSMELSIEDIRSVAPYFENCEALCYGRVEMMISEYCPVGSCADDCGRKSGKPLCMSKDIYITDRMNMKFPVRTDIYCRSHIYNSKLLSMIDSLKDLKDAGVNIFRLNMMEEDEKQVYMVTKGFRDTIDALKIGSMSLPGSAEQVIEYVKQKGFTKGHYYRGVE